MHSHSEKQAGSTQTEDNQKTFGIHTLSFRSSDKQARKFNDSGITAGELILEQTSKIYLVSNAKQNSCKCWRLRHMQQNSKVSLRHNQTVRKAAFTWDTKWPQPHWVPEDKYTTRPQPVQEPQAQKGWRFTLGTRSLSERSEMKRDHEIIYWHL